jgi:hypothetical protein
MKRKPASGTVRRSVALSGQLVRDVMAIAPPELRTNLNRLVIVALEEYAARRRQAAFEEAMALMAADPEIQQECDSIAREFAATESDGLRND